MKTEQRKPERLMQERPKTVIIMDGPHAVFVGFTDKENANRIIKILDDANRRYPTQ